MNTLILTIATLGVMAIVFAALLGIASKVFHVEVDEKESLVKEALPGANCGACGYPGCDGYAKAVSEGTAPINLCLVGAQPVADRVAEIMGGEKQESTRLVSTVRCNGTYDNTDLLFDYEGIKDCRVIKTLGGGSCKACQYSCQGCGTCVQQCEYDALKLVNGVVVVNENNCVACKKCVKVCPQNILYMAPHGEKAVVRCSSYSFGKQVKDACKVGCIGCGLCAKLAPDEFEMDGKLARVKHHKNFNMDNARKAAEKCPAKCIDIVGKAKIPTIEKAEEKETIRV